MSRSITYEVNDNSCWICTSHNKKSNRYPSIYLNGKEISIHRHMYTVYKGEIPKGLVIRHTCDDRKCINPDHLITGTLRDNAMDAYERMRHQRGDNHYRSKLSSEIVKEIKSNPSISCSEYAKKYNVGRIAIYKAIKGKTWRHVS